MANLIRTASLELETTSPKEVVKVAGIINRLKNRIKELLDSDYVEARRKLGLVSAVVQTHAEALREAINKLTEAINDGEIEAYQKYLEEVKALTLQLNASLQKVNDIAEDGKKETAQAASTETPDPSPGEGQVEPEKAGFDSQKMPEGLKQNRPTPPRSTNIYSYTPKEELKERLSSFLDKYNIEYGADISIPFKNMDYFNNRKIDASEKAKETLLDIIGKFLAKQKIEGSVGINGDKLYNLFLNNDKFNEVLYNAIINGTILKITHAMPGKRNDQNAQGKRPGGEMHILLKTTPFNLPDTNIKLILDLVLLDMSLKEVGPKTELSLKGLEEIYLVDKIYAADVPDVIKQGSRKQFFRSEILKSAGVDLTASKKLPDSFWTKFVEMSKRLGAKPEDLAKVINSESGFDPRAMNIQGGRVIAKGLNQLIKKTAVSLGMTPAQWDSFENVPAEQQLYFVEKYFKNVGAATKVSEWKSPTQLYLANFAPAHVHKTDPNAVLYSKEQGKAYEQNKGLDRDKKGYITAQDLSRGVLRPLPTHILEAINRAKTASGDSIPKADKSPIVEKSSPVSKAQTNQQADSLISQVFANRNLTSLVKEAYLPKTSMLITISNLSGPFSARMKFAKAAKKSLNDLCGIDSEISSNGDKIELTAESVGSTFTVLAGIQSVCECVQLIGSNKYNQPDIKFDVFPNVTSTLPRVK